MLSWEEVNKERVLVVKSFLKGAFPYGIQIFGSRNICGDAVRNIFIDKEHCIYIDYSGYGYVEVFGLTETELKLVKKECENEEDHSDEAMESRWNYKG